MKIYQFIDPIKSLSCPLVECVFWGEVLNVRGEFGLVEELFIMYGLFFGLNSIFFFYSAECFPKNHNHVMCYVIVVPSTLLFL